jgi:dTMP kinase
MQLPIKLLKELSANNPKPNGFFVIEGIEGSGKSTLINSLIESFAELEVNPIKTREPGGTNLGIKLREILLSKTDTKISSMSELLIFYADRAQHLVEVIEPAISNRQLIICDRFIYSTLAYQAYGRGLDITTIDHLNNLVLKSLKPDGVILLDINPVESLKRASNRGELDRFELENLEFHQKIRNGYLQLAKESSEIFKLINATNSPLEILEEAIQFIFLKSNAKS